MPDYLEIIHEAILQHHAIRHQVEAVGGSVSDLEAFLGLQKVYSDWAQSSVSLIPEKQKIVKQVIANLAEGLFKHFGFEEKAFPPIFGTVLMRVIMFEHTNIRRQLEKVRAEADIPLEGLSQEETLSRKAHLQQEMGILNQMIEEHASSEDLILEKLQKALEAERKGGV